MEWDSDRHVEAVDDHLRFIAHWDGRKRHVFVLAKLVDEMAGKVLCRSASEAFVTDNINLFIAAAYRVAKERPQGLSYIITVDRMSDLEGHNRPVKRA